MRKVFGILLLTLMGSMFGIGFYKFFFEKQKVVYIQSSELSPTFSRFTDDDEPVKNDKTMVLPDFVSASDITRPAVVHIKSTYRSSASGESGGLANPFREFFGEDGFEIPKGQASGSGVIISSDGYITTNNHVIEDADEVEVVMLDNRQFKAKVIGTDLNTDLALLKIDATDLPFLKFGDSDAVRIGEWVMAVGNPLDLNSTVTAGIVSAKGRNINLLREDTQYAIESFIQTDAAVNRGNSGGALVNLEGELVGINTAIASKTGYYAGYSFAIPSSIVKKVMEDLLNFGEVKRGFLGVTIQTVNSELADAENLSTFSGAYVTNVNTGSGAAEAGIRSGDVIVAVDGVGVGSTPELQEQVSRHRPGDLIKIKVLRGSAEKTFDVVLKTIDNHKTAAIAQQKKPERDERAFIQGSTFSLLSEAEKESLGVKFGVRVEKAGEKLSRGGIQDDFVITDVNGTAVRDLDDLSNALSDADGYVTIKGLYSEGMMATYSFNY
jgi:Do/DeqQ family serine protease